jgi:hypothetical protein
MEVVANDPTKPHPEPMSEDVRRRFQSGETLEKATKKNYYD